MRITCQDDSERRKKKRVSELGRKEGREERQRKRKRERRMV